MSRNGLKPVSSVRSEVSYASLSCYEVIFNRNLIALVLLAKVILRKISKLNHKSRLCPSMN